MATRRKTPFCSHFRHQDHHVAHSSASKLQDNRSSSDDTEPNSKGLDAVVFIDEKAALARCFEVDETLELLLDFGGGTGDGGLHIGSLRLWRS